MKKILFLMCSCLILLAGCKTGVFTSEYGKEDVAFISLVSSDALANKDVEVYIDENAPFTVHVQKSKQSTVKHNGKLFSIMPGKRHMKIVYNGETIYEKDIFVSSQQTKLINL